MKTKHSLIENIRKEVIKANPSILDLKRGCFIKIEDFGIGEFSDHWINGKSPIHHETGGYYVIKHGMGWDGYYCDKKCIYTISDGVKQENKDVEILGRTIGIADVLLAINKNYNHIVELRSSGEILLQKISGGDIDYVSDWDLKNDNLESQSEETLLFINNLLTQ